MEYQSHAYLVEVERRAEWGGIPSHSICSPLLETLRLGFVPKHLLSHSDLDKFRLITNYKRYLVFLNIKN